MNVCASYNCDDLAGDSDTLCRRCREEIDARSDPPRPSKPINWLAVFFVFATLLAYAVITLTRKHP